MLAVREQMTDDDVYLKVNEVARRLHVATNTILRWIANRELPAVRTSAGYRISERDLDEFLNNRRTM
jgi:excisionase family DNA binding protein